jgi:iron-sulfur cluster assembly protein
VFNLDGVKVVVDKKSFTYLKGMTIVWSGNLLSGGFEFENPNATKSCGCGTSFTV